MEIEQILQTTATRLNAFSKQMALQVEEERINQVVKVRQALTTQNAAFTPMLSHTRHTFCTTAAFSPVTTASLHYCTPVGSEACQPTPPEPDFFHANFTRLTNSQHGAEVTCEVL